ncbi:MAG TPA: hypothetical protein V6D22_13215 [Candidatus Obscuribacterales bacterium]
MSIKRTLTAVAVDSARDYLLERIEKLKELDLDKDGQRDVDQVAALLNQLAVKVTAAVESTDFQKLATGLEQVITGAGMIGASVDRQKLTAAGEELHSGLRQLGKLLKLGIQEVKRQEKG